MTMMGDVMGDAEVNAVRTQCHVQGSMGLGFGVWGWGLMLFSLSRTQFGLSEREFFWKFCKRSPFDKAGTVAVVQSRQRRCNRMHHSSTQLLR